MLHVTRHQVRFPRHQVAEAVDEDCLDTRAASLRPASGDGRSCERVSSRYMGGWSGAQCGTRTIPEVVAERELPAFAFPGLLPILARVDVGLWKPFVLWADSCRGSCLLVTIANKSYDSEIPSPVYLHPLRPPGWTRLSQHDFGHVAWRC